MGGKPQGFGKNSVSEEDMEYSPSRGTRSRVPIVLSARKRWNKGENAPKKPSWDCDMVADVTGEGMSRGF